MDMVNLFFKYINLELFEGLVEGTKPTRHNGGFRLTVIYIRSRFTLAFLGSRFHDRYGLIYQETTLKLFLCLPWLYA